ncbi:MAG TPA: energy-coupling factor transporter transmembrane component T [Syntrophomonadaceae bacterium]|nr:energy-coupling factor transporter transmembrane component T [Syntrophomonadaceae bacterium]HQA08310.1 energy-coupling factor transporter transmembrane component T [Syntrophomonadaceae bacterium]HQE23910.1 energy-coupling factor transporter transmembrane component T [Syntrophomonadaceae bacterium]
MYQIPVFIEKNRPLFKLHYGVLAAMHLYLLVFALVFDHPVYLLAMLAAIAVLMWTADTISYWSAYLRMSIPLIIFIIILNVLFSRAGSTPIFNGPIILFSANYYLPFTWEALFYGVGMALRLLVIISSCASFFALVSPAKVLGMLSLFGARWALTFNLTLRLIPLMMEEYHRISEVQRCRGVEWTGRGVINRVKSFFPVSSILLLSSLERSVAMAESMYGRGFGSGPRTSYYQNAWQRHDSWAALCLTIAGVISIWALIAGWVEYSYYPQLSLIRWTEIWPALVIGGLLVIPALRTGGDLAATADELTESELYLSGQQTP